MGKAGGRPLLLLGCELLCWLALNALVLQPAFERINARAFSDWRCSTLGRSTSNDTGLEVLLASPGTTGTTSMQMALEALGYRTYHMEEVEFYFPEIYAADVTPEDLVEPIRRCGVRALFVEPFLDLTPKLLRVSPKARVVLMLRPWEEWAPARRRATQSPDGQPWLSLDRRLCHWLPLGPLWQRAISAERGRSFVAAARAPSTPSGSWLRWLHAATGFDASDPSAVYLHHCIKDSWFGLTSGFSPLPEATMSRIYIQWWHLEPFGVSCENFFCHQGMLSNKTLYYAYQDYVRDLVPPDRLLNFDIQVHGWPELLTFLEQPTVSASSLGPFPHSRSGGTRAIVVSQQQQPAVYMAVWLLMLSTVLANGAAFHLCARLLLARGRPLAAAPWPRSAGRGKSD